MKIIQNYLDPTVFKQLQNHVVWNTDFPMYMINLDNVSRVKGHKHEWLGAHVIYGSNEPKSPHYNYFVKVFQPALKWRILIRVKVNFYPGTDKIYEHATHIDREFEHKVALFSLNTCNGYTKLENGEKITSKKNRYLEFDCNTKHSGSSCTDEKRRVVINFNYS